MRGVATKKFLVFLILAMFILTGWSPRAQTLVLCIGPAGHAHLAGVHAAQAAPPATHPAEMTASRSSGHECRHILLPRLDSLPTQSKKSASHAPDTEQAGTIQQPGLLPAWSGPPLQVSLRSHQPPTPVPHLTHLRCVILIC